MPVDLRAPIRVYMTKKLIGVKPDDTVKRAGGEVMVEFDIGSLVVVDENGDVVGFLTKGDIIRRMVIPRPAKHHSREGDNDERPRNRALNGPPAGGKSSICSQRRASSTSSWRRKEK